MTKKINWRKWGKRFLIGAGIALAVLVVFLCVIWLLFGRQKTAQPDQIKWGVTYSAPAAEELHLDPVKTYRAIITDLKPQRLRLIAYWNRIETKAGTYDFPGLGSQTQLAGAASFSLIGKVACGGRSGG